MKPIKVVSCGAAGSQPADPLFAAVRGALASEFRTAASVARQPLDPAFAHHPERNQYHSTAILEQLGRMNGSDEILIGVTAVDLYIPILTFVFGEAQLGGHCAVVSYHRLTQEFYGLPADRELLTDRLVKEAIHEVGHTLGLTHCDDYECVMAAAHSVEWLDLKGRARCTDCFHNSAL